MRELPVRKKIRLKGYDDSQAGCYFVTICVHNRHEMLGRMDVGAESTRPYMGTNFGVLQIYNIRSEEEYQKIWRYMDENPARWQEDRNFLHDRS